MNEHVISHPPPRSGVPYRSVRVSDGLGAYQQVNFTLILNDVNRPPDWPGRLPARYSMLEGTNVTFTYVAVDPDGGPSTMEAHNLPFGRGQRPFTFTRRDAAQAASKLVCFVSRFPFPVSRFPFHVSSPLSDALYTPPHGALCISFSHAVFISYHIVSSSELNRRRSSERREWECNGGDSLCSRVHV